MIIRKDVSGRNMILLQVCIYMVLFKQSEGTCIKSVESTSSETLILNSVNVSLCVRINEGSSDNQIVIRNLQVNKTCVREPHVKMMALVLGEHHCVMQEFLFVHQEKSGCSMDIRCQSQKGIPYGNNATLCLLKCPIEEGTDETYEIQLTSGYEPGNLELCGLQMYQVNWIQPNEWTGPEASFYMSFDTPEHLTLMEGTVETNFAVLVPGLINSATATDRTKKQWIDLGIHTEACMTRPETCGAAGGAVSMWLKLNNCTDWHGVISSHNSGTGFVLYCRNDNNEIMRFYVYLPDGTFATYPNKPTGWTHVVLNYIGPNIGEGIRNYYNGGKVGSDNTKWDASRSAADGRVVVGRYFTGRSQRYSSVEIDELIFFNQYLSIEEIRKLYNFV